jgi:glycine C-acetyltransferase
MMDNGCHVNGIEWPVVSTGQARLRVTLMPQHTKDHLDTFVTTFEKCFKEANEIFDKSMKEFEEQQSKSNKPKL